MTPTCTWAHSTFDISEKFDFGGMSDTDWTDTFADADYESEILNEFCAGLSGALGVRVFNDQDLDQDLDRYKYLSATKMITDGWCRTENGRIVIDLLRGGNRRSAGRCNGANLYLDKIPRAWREKFGGEYDIILGAPLKSWRTGKFANISDCVEWEKTLQIFSGSDLTGSPAAVLDMGKRRRSRPEDSPWQVCVIGSRAGDNAFTLSSLKGAPRRVDWDFEVFGWKELDNLDGLPEYVKGDVGLRCPAGPAGHPASGPAAGDADGKIKPLFTDGIRRRFLSLDIHCDPGRSEIPQGSTPAPRRHDAPGGVDAAWIHVLPGSDPATAIFPGLDVDADINLPARPLASARGKRMDNPETGRAYMDWLREANGWKGRMKYLKYQW